MAAIARLTAYQPGLIRSSEQGLNFKLKIELSCADLLNVFETFLPQLLLYPNPTDPLNGEAAALLMREPEAYNAKVKGTVL